MGQFITCKATWDDNSSGVTDETGQELQIWTDSPSFRPDVPIDYAVAPHPWMRLLPVAAGEVEAEFRLELPVTFVTFRVRQYNDDGVGDWSTPAGTTFTVAPQQGANVPQAPVNPGFVVLSGGVVTPPPPPVDPPPPPPPSGGGGSSSNYTFSTQFSSTQGLNQWSYLDANNTPLSYNSGSALWAGAQAYQTLWAGGIHPGTSVGTKLRWTAPAGGTAIVSGSAALLASSGTFGVTLQIYHNAGSIEGPTSLTTTTPVAISETVVMSANDTLDFVVTAISGNSSCSTALSPAIQFTTDGSTPANPVLSTLLPATAAVSVGGSTPLTATLSSNAPAPITVSLSSSDVTKVTVPASVVVPAGQSSVTFTASGAAAGSSTITATYDGVNKTATVTTSNPPSGAWANAPIGGTVLVDNDCSADPDLSPGFLDFYNGATLLRSDASAPLSPSGCWVHRLEALATSGGGQLHFTAGQMYRELYLGVRMRTNPQFQGRIVANKMFFLRSNTIQSNGCFCFNNGRLQNGRGTIIFTVNGGATNQHIFGPNSDSGTFFFPNTGASGQMTAGVWTKLEFRLRASTTISSQDGVLQIWVDDVLSHDYRNINYSNGTGLNEWVMSQTWDQSGDMGVSNTVPWEYWIDHLYLVGKN